MGVCMTPVYDIDIPEAEYSDGKVLFRLGDVLARVAEAKGLPSLWAFCRDAEDWSVILGVDPKDDNDRDGSAPAPPAEWHACADGLRTVHGLIQALESEPWAAEEVRRASFPVRDLVEELQELERCLGAAALRGARFYFLLW